MNHVIQKITEAELARWRNDADRAEKTARKRVEKFAQKNTTPSTTCPG